MSSDVREFVRSRDGTRLATWRLGEGPPVLVSAPIGIHPDAWRLVAEALDGRASLALYACRGMWESDIPQVESAVTVADHAEDVIAVADALNDKPIGYLGYCSGSLPLLEALAGGLSVRATMIVSPLFRRGAHEAMISRFITRVNGHSRARDALLSFVYEFSPIEYRERVRTALDDEARLHSFLMTIQGLYLHTPNPQRAKEVPIRFAAAAEDGLAICQSITHFMAARRNFADDVVELNGHHFSIFTRPEETAHQILAWLGRRRNDEQESRAS